MASGDTLDKFQPGAALPRATNPALPGRRNEHTFIAFTTAADEETVFKSVLLGYGAGGIDAEIEIMMATATTGNIEIEGAFERVQRDTLDTDADSFAAKQTTGAVAVPATAAGRTKKVTISFTNGQIDGLVDGEEYRFKINRRNAVASNATGDLQVRAVVLKEA